MPKQSSDIAAAIGRLLIALIFLVAGIGKIAAPGMTQGYIASAGLPLPLVGYLGAIAVEIGASALLIVGYQSRIAAAVLAAFTMATAVSFHSEFTDQNQMIHFLKNVAMTGGLLQVLAFGAGGISIDSRRNRSRNAGFPGRFTTGPDQA